MAGLGERLKSDVPKPFVLIDGIPLFVHTLRVFESLNEVDSIICVAHADALNEVEEAVETFGIQKVKDIVAGGATRFESVNNGLKTVDKDTDVVIVHDGARPFATAELIQQCIQQCAKTGAVIAAVPVKHTIKQVNTHTMTVEGTLDRNSVWEVQTPQVFKADVLRNAHESATDNKATDDAVLVEQSGHAVSIVRGDYKNIKVTTQEDLAHCASLLKEGAA